MQPLLPRLKVNTDELFSFLVQQFLPRANSVYVAPLFTSFAKIRYTLERSAWKSDATCEFVWFGKLFVNDKVSDTRMYVPPIYESSFPYVHRMVVQQR